MISRTFALAGAIFILSVGLRAETNIPAGPTAPFEPTWESLSTHQGCASAYGPTRMKLEAADRTFEFDVPGTPSWTAIQKVRAGEISVLTPGVYHIILQPASDETWKAVNVFAIEFTRKPT